MKAILAIEASTSLCSVSLSVNGKVTERRSGEPRAHTLHLMQFIDESLQEQQLAVGDLDCILFGAGPGSFTGVRLAAAVAKSLAYAAGIPVKGISSLAVLAQGYFLQNPEYKQPCLVVVDARMDEYYVGYYQQNAQSQTEALKDDALLTPEQLQALQNELQPQLWLSDGSEWVQQAKPEQQAIIEVIEPNASYLIAHYLRHGQLSSSTEKAATHTADKALVNSALTEQVNYLRGKSGWKNLEQQKKM